MKMSEAATTPLPVQKRWMKNQEVLNNYFQLEIVMEKNNLNMLGQI